MAAEDIGLNFISKKEFGEYYSKKLPAHALANNGNYMFAAVLEEDLEDRVNSDALTVPVQLQFPENEWFKVEREWGRLVIMTFLNNYSGNGYLFENGAWMPNVLSRLIFRHPTKKILVVEKGCFVPNEPDIDPDQLVRELKEYLESQAATPVLLS